MTLEPTFALTPRASYFYSATDYQARLYIYGTLFGPKYSDTYRNSLDHQHAEDEACFIFASTADPSVDYSNWQDRRRVPYVHLYLNLASFGTQKESALVFGFDAISTNARLLIFSAAGQLGDETLAIEDNQFLMEIESLDTSLNL